MSRSAIALWHIYHVEKCAYTTPPKSKFVIIACVDKHPMGFLINSSIHPFIRDREDLSKCQAAINADEHQCLRNHSYIDCSHIYQFFDWELKQRRDPVSQHAKRAIIDALNDCIVIERKYKNMILDSEKALLDEILREARKKSGKDSPPSE